MTRFSVVVVFHLSVFAFSAIVSETTRGTLPALPDHIKTRLVVREGTKTYTIQCPAEGAPQPLIMWTKDGESITHAWNRFRQMNNDRDLRIKNVALEDAGLYKCQAVNGFGTVDLEYTVVVIGKDEPQVLDDGEEDDDDFQPPELKGATGRSPFWIRSDQIKEQSRTPIVRTVGSSIKLKCFAAGHPVPDVLWFKDNEPMDELRDNKWILHLRHLQTSNAGKYTCRVVNMFGGLNATFTLEITDNASLKTEFEKSFMNTSIQEGQTATFQCKVRSTVTPAIKWIKKVDEEVQTDDNKTFLYEGVLYRVLEVNPPDVAAYPNNTYMKQLVILNVKPKDAGWYFCVVPDSDGNIVNRSAHLKVLPISDFDVPVSEQVPVNEQLSLHIVVGVPVAILLLLLVGYAIYFLQKHQQKPSNANRPQPPNYPPPSVPASHKASSSPYRNTTNSTSTNNGGMPPLTASSKDAHHSSSSPYAKDYKAYHHLDPMACVPLNSQCPPSERDLYEATPQPYELHLEHSDFSDCYDGSGGRVQHYPSMYSCR